MGYHTRQFAKGVYGEFSKVEEEWEELLDARKQNARILELCEIADLYGAISGYVRKNFPGMTMMDVILMSEMTSSAFTEGTRVPSVQPVVDCVSCLLSSEEEPSVVIRADGLPACNDCWREIKRLQK